MFCYPHLIRTTDVCVGIINVSKYENNVDIEYPNSLAHHHDFYASNRQEVEEIYQ